MVKDTPVFLRTSTASTGVLASSGSLVLKNIRLDNVPTAVGVAGGAVVLAGSTGTMTIDSWGQGNVYTGTNSAGTFTQGDLPSASIPSSLLDSTGRVVGRGHPQYEEYSVDQFVSVKDCGAVGDGFTDDTDALQEILNEVSVLIVDSSCFQVRTAYLDSVCGIQNYLLRCRDIHRYLDHHHSCRISDRRRGMVRDCRPRKPLRGPEQSSSCGEGRRERIPRYNGDYGYRFQHRWTW